LLRQLEHSDEGGFEGRSVGRAKDADGIVIRMMIGAEVAHGHITMRVLNEGVSKGILVTTSDYGPDSYEFAKGKPLVLLNGANLLNLLEKHGHKAKINLKEAKIILAEQA
jgi:hypothetical protein